MVEIEIQDFQSIQHLKFDINGFTVLVGRSNIGKSSIARAIRCALTGASGTDFVRHGPTCERRRRGNKKCKCFASVRIRTDAIELTWKKGDEVNLYEVLKPGDTEVTTYSSVGRGTPEFLQPDFEPVKVGTGPPELIQVSEQFFPIFLLNQSGNTVADVLSNVAQLDDINVAMGEVSKDRKADLSTRKVREKDIKSLNDTLAGYKGLDAALDDVDQVGEAYKAVQEAHDAAIRLDRFIERARTLSKTFRALKAALEPSVPDGEALKAAADKAAQTARFYETLSTKAVRTRSLRGVEKVELPDSEGLKEALGKSDRIDLWITRLREFKAKVVRWKGLDVSLPDPVPLSSARDRATEVESFLSRLGKLQASKKKLKDALTEVELREGAIRKDIDELGICPTCSQDINAEGCLHLEGEA